MPDQRPSTGSDHGEEERAFFQARVALFWKIIFFVMLLGSALGVVGAVKKPGPDLILTMSIAVQSGFLWWLCRRGVWSMRFLRWIEGGGLLLFGLMSAMLSRYILVGFTREHGVAGGQAFVLSDAYISMIQVAGMTTQAAIRAGLIPSRPRRTVLVTALFGGPMILVNCFLVPTADGSFALRPLDSEAFPWMPMNMLMMATFTVISCTAISWVIYGLRAQVREARRLGQYVLEAKLGEGGMGEVYRAHHGMMRRPSAIKLLRSDRTGELDLVRFEREVRQTARLTHPNTITIFDYGRTHDGIFYYAMELLDGATLQRIVAVDGAQPAGRVVRILGMVCGALTEAHDIGLIHRDIKPANIMLCTQGGERDVVKLLDFGLVKEVAVDRGVNLTAATTIVGTPRYMAPESIRQPDAADARTDIYAVGAVAYYLLAGVDVFDGTSTVEVCAQHLHQQPQSLTSRGIAVPAELEAIVLACLEKDPARRPQTAAELRRRLEACPTTPWDSVQARAWWAEHQPRLQADPLQGGGDGLTIAVDGASRSVAARA